jgi:hypothetical protein
MFLNLPSYMGMGYETKNLHANNSTEYSNQYVKNQNEPFMFGQNSIQFNQISNIRDFYIKYKDMINFKDIYMLNVGDKKLAWTYPLKNNKKLLFAVNLDVDTNIIKTNLKDFQTAKLLYTNSEYNELSQNITNQNGVFLIENIYIGECVIYELD